MDEYVAKMLDAGLVEPGFGAWSSPLMVVPKGDGSWRPVVDMRRLNKLVVKDSYPMPLVEETINNLGGAEWYSKIDMLTAFFSMELDKGSRDLAAFMTRTHGLCRFTVLPMGLSTAPQKFQRGVDEALGALQPTVCVSFFDDCCVHSRQSLKDHMEKTMTVIGALDDYGFTGNPKKCVFAQRSLGFLGHTISKAGVTMMGDKLEAMVSYKRPTSQRELLGFLALTSYYRKFISNYAHIASPLYSLMQDDNDKHRGPQSRKARMRVTWSGSEWTREHEQAFRTLKGALLTAPVLAMPNATGKFVLSCDASNVAWGAVLAQIGEDGLEHPIAYYSKKLLPSERKWDIWEKECSACVWATDKCRCFLMGNQFDLVTDSKVVLALLSNSESMSRRANWVMRLSEFDFVVVHRKGEHNPVADFFSRWASGCVQAYEEYELQTAKSQINTLHAALDATEDLVSKAYAPEIAHGFLYYNSESSDNDDEPEPPLLSSSDEEMNDPPVEPPRPDQAESEPGENSEPKADIDIPFPRWLAEQQRADPYLGAIIARLKAGEPPLEAKEDKPGSAKIEFRLLMNEEILATKRRIRGPRLTFTEHWSIMAPRTSITAILEIYHGTGSVHSHNGRNKTISQIRKRFTWPSMHADVAKWIKACPHCVARKGIVLTQARYELSTRVDAPFHRLCIDFVGPLTTTRRKNSYILTMICPFSRWAEAFAVTRNTAIKTIACLKQHISTYGTPSELLSDRGFLSQPIKDFLASKGIKHLCTAAYTPATNGSVEGFHRFLATTLSALVNSRHSDWDEHLPDTMLSYRTAAIDGMGLSPFEIVFGRPPNLPLDNVLAEVAQVEKLAEELRSPADHAALVAEAHMENNESIRETQASRHERNKRQDEGLPTRAQFEVGETIYLKYPKGHFRPPDGGTTKFSKVNNGPYDITKKFAMSSGATVYEVQHRVTKFSCKVGRGRMIPFDEWKEPEGTSRPANLPGHPIRAVRSERAATRAAASAEPMETDEPQASSEGAQESKDSDPPSEMKPPRKTERGNSRTEERRERPAEPREEQQSRKRKRDDPAAKKDNDYAKAYSTTAATRRARLPPGDREFHTMQPAMQTVWAFLAHPGSGQ